MNFYSNEHERNGLTNGLWNGFNFANLPNEIFIPKVSNLPNEVFGSKVEIVSLQENSYRMLNARNENSTTLGASLAATLGASLSATLGASLGATLGASDGPMVAAGELLDQTTLAEEFETWNKNLTSLIEASTSGTGENIPSA